VQGPPSITTAQGKEDEQHDSLQANLPCGVSWMARGLDYVANEVIQNYMDSQAKQQA
jgi:hypothetical protein